MSRFLASVGILITLLYLAGLISLFYGRVPDIFAMSPNNIGDFLAGVFGPLAVLWLILGFFQQGIELRQNTRALNLQAKELKNAVEQQRELVAVTRSQVEAERAAADFERQRHAEAALPRFSLPNAGSTTSGVDTTHQVTFMNRGATATRVHLEFTPPIRSAAGFDFPIAGSDFSQRLDLQFQPGHPQAGDGLVITFLDATGRPGSTRYNVEVRDGTLEIAPNWVT